VVKDIAASSIFVAAAIAIVFELLSPRYPIPQFPDCAIC
jgi:hypothetical protein